MKPKTCKVCGKKTDQPTHTCMKPKTKKTKLKSFWANEYSTDFGTTDLGTAWRDEQSAKNAAHTDAARIAVEFREVPGSGIKPKKEGR